MVNFILIRRADSGFVFPAVIDHATKNNTIYARWESASKRRPGLTQPAPIDGFRLRIEPGQPTDEQQAHLLDLIRQEIEA